MDQRIASLTLCTERQARKLQRPLMRDHDIDTARQNPQVSKMVCHRSSPMLRHLFCSGRYSPASEME